jgi:hypothetical protein
MSGIGRISLAAAGLFLVLAAILFGFAALDALRVGEDGPASAGAEALAAVPGGTGAEADPGAPSGSDSGADPGAGPGADPGAASPRRGLYPRVTETEILEAVNQDLFQPDRTPPLERYRFPADRVVQTAIAEEGPGRRRGFDLRIVGAATMGDMALALVQVDDSIPFAVLLGESVEGYTLVAVDEESATLMGEDETLTLPVQPPLTTAGARVPGGPVQVGPRVPEGMEERVQEFLRAQMMNRGRDATGRGGRRGGGGQP